MNKKKTDLLAVLLSSLQLLTSRACGI